MNPRCLKIKGYRSSDPNLTVALPPQIKVAFPPFWIKIWKAANAAVLLD